MCDEGEGRWGGGRGGEGGASCKSKESATNFKIATSSHASIVKDSFTKRTASADGEGMRMGFGENTIL